MNIVCTFTCIFLLSKHCLKIPPAPCKMTYQAATAGGALNRNHLFSFIILRLSSKFCSGLRACRRLQHFLSQRALGKMLVESNCSWILRIFSRPTDLQSGQKWWFRLSNSKLSKADKRITPIFWGRLDPPDPPYGLLSLAQLYNV